MNERIHFFIKIYLSHFILERVDVSVVCERWVDRYILRELLLPISSSRSQGVPTLTPLTSSSETPLIGCVSLARLWFSALYKSHCVVLITWSPFGDTPVRAECPDMPSLSCLLIKMWQLTKAHGVTRNKPKIHVICYITQVLFAIHIVITRVCLT